ncbi:hypothetical protein EVAR_71630_1 [Eumeta japonica]|uniref:Uncharacterized protein n=1 Tax=Eumeta variegata TaxID=151549 RepID=A0A4C1TBW0_EUMVA|nr:hypothetical protein EVAR_71630_1 [Eumeta japonica]
MRILFYPQCAEQELMRRARAMIEYAPLFEQKSQKKKERLCSAHFLTDYKSRTEMLRMIGENAEISRQKIPKT